MKTSKLAFALTALFTSCISDAAHIVTVKTELIIRKSKRGQKIQNSVATEQKKLAAPFEKLEAQIKEQEAILIEKQKALAQEDENFISRRSC